MQVKNLILILLILNCCGNKYNIKNFQLYQKTNIPHSENIAPREELMDYKRDVVVMDFSVKGLKDIKDIEDIGQFAASILTRSLSKTKWINILDRNLTEKIASEIKLLEMNKSSFNYSGPKEAEYIIIGEINEVLYKSELINRWFLNGIIKTGMLFTCILAKSGFCLISDFIPAKYNYTATISGSVKVFDTKKNQIIKEVQFSKVFEDSEAAEASKGFISSNGFKDPKVFDKSLISRGITDILSDISRELEDCLPLKGFISERRDLNNESNVLFRIETGDKIKLNDIQNSGICTHLYKKENDITKESYNEVVEIEVFKTNLSDERGIWLSLPQDNSHILRIGDFCYIKKNNEN